MQSDCNYMLGNGGAGAIRYLDGENVDTHIHNMLELYNSFSDNAKPEWISVEEIEGYREKLTALVAASGKEIQQNSVEKAESQKPEIPSDVDKFYVQPEIEQVTWIYYNPDSAAGGQLVYNYLTYDDIFNAVLKDDPMEYLLENCKQETLDRGSAGFDGAVEEFMTDSEDISSREENYVGKLLALTEPRYAIYQLKDGEELRDYRFTNSEYMQAHGMYADRENYNQVYRGRMQENETLEDIFAKFNVNRPEDFHGHSLSVSDIICVKQNGKITAHFVDSVGFKEVPDFTLSREERKVRRTLTDNLTLLADNQLASDEMDTLADKLFNYEKAQKYSGTSSRWLIGAGKTADKFEDITTRYHNGEDVRAELAKGMYGKLNHIEFFGSKDGIDDVDISATKSEESITFRTKGGFEVTHSWETLGEALITAAKQEYDRHEELDRQFGTQEKTPEIIAEPVHDTADFDEIPNDISDKEQKPVAPAWEQRKKSKVKSFDLHPDVPMSERNNFDLRSNPVEQVGKKERFRRNAEAIKVLKECKFENRFATPEEQLVLSKYVGWGGLPEAFDENNSAWANEFAELYTILSPEEYAAARESTLTAFYTPPDVINAEKYSLGRTIAEALGAYKKTVNPKEPSIAHWSLNLNGEEAILCHGAGHLCGLAPAEDYNESYKFWSFDNYPIIPEHFITRVKDNNYSRLAYDYVKQFFDKADLIINATDADREGELIFAYLYEVLHCTVPYKRVWITDLTPFKIRKAFAELRPAKDMKPLENAGRIRSATDWLVGINTSVAATLKFGGTDNVFACGRVKMPTLAMIVKREREIRNYVKKPFYKIVANIEATDGAKFTAEAADKYDTETAAKAVIDEIKLNTAKAIKVEVLQKQTAAPLLYNTTHLLADLSKCTDLTIDMLTKLVQSLYENRLITYPRTSSEHLTDAMKDETVKIIKLLFEMPEFAKYAIPVDNFAPCTRRHYDDSKVDSHTAITPTALVPNDLSGMSENERNTLICPLCSKPLIKKKVGWCCTGYSKDNPDSCRFYIANEICGKKISDVIAKELTLKRSTSIIKGFTSQSGKTFDAKLTIKADNTIGFEFPERLKCPVCGKEMIKSSKGWVCTGYKNGCNFL